MKTAFNQQQAEVGYDFPALNSKNFKHLEHFATEDFKDSREQAKLAIYSYNKDVSKDSQTISEKLPAYKTVDYHLENLSNTSLHKIMAQERNYYDHQRERKVERLVRRAIGAVGFVLGAATCVAGIASLVFGKIGPIDTRDLPINSTIVAALGAAAMKYCAGHVRMLFKKDDLDNSQFHYDCMLEADKLRFMKNNGQEVTQDSLLVDNNSRKILIQQDVNRVAATDKENVYKADIIESTSGTTEALFRKEGIFQTEKIPYMKETLKWAQTLEHKAQI